MSCNFDLCELINMLIGGLLIGIIASFAFVYISELVNNCRFKKKYRYLLSKDGFDWVGHEVKERTKGKAISKAKIHSVDKSKISIELHHEDQNQKISVWTGDLFNIKDGYGTLAFVYQNEGEYEFGERLCMIKAVKEGDKLFDCLYFMPLINYLHTFSGQSTLDGKFEGTVKYDYGYEVLQREKLPK